MKENGRKVLYPLIMLGFGLGGGILLGKGAVAAASRHTERPVLLYMGAALLWAYFSMFIQIVIHEGGHLVFGLLSGYRFVSFRVFGMMWVRDHGKIVRRNYSLAGTGGQCLMDAPDSNPFPAVLYNMGGVIMNLLASACALLLCTVFRGELFRLFAGTFAAVGVVYALVNGLPIRTAAIQNDGANTLEILKYPETKEALRKQLRINALMSDGKRLKEMASELFEADASGYGHSLIASVGVFRIMYLIDRHCFAEADEQIAKLRDLSSVPGIYKMQMEIEHVFLQIMNGNRDPSMITENFRSALRAMRNSLSAVRTAYAVQLHVLKNRFEAEKHRQRFKQMSMSWPYEGEKEEEAELMELISGLEQI